MTDLSTVPKKALNLPFMNKILNLCQKNTNELFNLTVEDWDFRTFFFILIIEVEVFNIVFPGKFVSVFRVFIMWHQLKKTTAVVEQNQLYNCSRKFVCLLLRACSHCLLEHTNRHMKIVVLNIFFETQIVMEEIGNRTRNRKGWLSFFCPTPSLHLRHNKE